MPTLNESLITIKTCLTSQNIAIPLTHVIAVNLVNSSGEPALCTSISAIRP